MLKYKIYLQQKVKMTIYNKYTSMYIKQRLWANFKVIFFSNQKLHTFTFVHTQSFGSVDPVNEIKRYNINYAPVEYLHTYIDYSF